VNIQSSLTLALLRCIFTDGTVYLDGLATNEVNLENLRSNITIIPQSVYPFFYSLATTLSIFSARVTEWLAQLLESNVLGTHSYLGTLRYNLDPFDEYDDATLNAALKASGLYALRTDPEVEGRLGLDTVIASSGSNISAGQCQIIALARAIVRSSKLLILDEGSCLGVCFVNQSRILMTLRWLKPHPQ
jgi:ABC-type multidrug transport system fused ATPase/permease subunit